MCFDICVGGWYMYGLVKEEDAHVRHTVNIKNSSEIGHAYSTHTTCSTFYMYVVCRTCIMYMYVHMYVQVDETK